MSDECMIYKIALSMVKKMSPAVVRHIYDSGLTAEDFFTLDTPTLSDHLKLKASESFDRSMRDEALDKASREADNMKAHNIRCHFMMDSDYPARLSAVDNPPILLYSLGNADLDPRYSVSIVGTRKPTSYGIEFTKKLVTELATYFPDLTIVSGLAYGIDAAAHQAALDAGITTVAVVAHGLNMIYPAAHREFARRIIHQGGALISEYPFGTQPYRQRFLERNRIVAAIADVTVVAESAVKGGAMSTANTAFSYSRDVMALPGRITDTLSAGCNLLIRKEKAHIITSTSDLIELTGWLPLDLKIDTSQRNLFPELDGDQRLIYEALRYEHEPMQTDRLHHITLIPVPRLMSILGEMEFDGIIIRLPGNRYSIS